ncbi:VCBS repeat-containing protein [Luteitalea sp. TBR-22]|uniref:FG-GAP repeat domain-containing protein n=1 Tax=Luteitalea sp. TBR-22 TaxID=2802971 RepID=UPI001EF4ECAF|nr:VCBS repeat-containing protein [Luteitalea sp. TBR-22]
MHLQAWDRARRPALRWLIALALLGGAPAVYPSASPAATATTGGPAALPPDLPVATEAEVRQRCGTVCHRMPPPDILPRAAWRDELVRMQLIMDGVPEPAGMMGAATAMIPLPPDMLRIQRFYEQGAPEALPAHTPWPAGPSPADFDREALRLEGQPGASLPAVANVRLLDLDGDGAAEIVASDMRAGLVMAGPTSKGATLRVIAEVPHPSHIERVDLDKDGLQDLLVGDLGSFQPADHTNGAIVWLRRGKDGAYTPITLARQLGRVADVRAADFDGDGDLDLVAAVFGWRKTGSLLLLQNQTKDWKSPQFLIAELDRRHGAIHVPVTDLNADGRPDIVVLFAQEHETVAALVNAGNGTFRTETIFEGPHPNWGSSGIELVDMDKDGDLDVLHTHGDTFDDFILKPYHGITLLENRGSFPYVATSIASLPGAHRALAADLDGDGDLDIAAAAMVAGGGGPAEATLPAVVWLEQTAPGTWARHPIKVGTPAYATLDVGDIDKDGRPDLVVGSFAFGRPMDSVVDVWRNRKAR